MEQEYKYMVATRCFTFNHAPYIEDAMNGFAMQETSFPVITIIVDDASTDGEPEVIRNYLAEHFKLPYRTEETEYAHIICAKHKTNANCDFVVFLLKYNHYSIKKSKFPYLSEWLDNAKYHALCEGDDYWSDPQKLQIQVDSMERDDSYVLCYTNYNILLQNREVISSNIKNLPESGDYSLDQIVKGNKVATLTVLYRKKSFDTIPKLWTQHRWKMGDLPLWIELSQQGLFKYIPKNTAVYRKLDLSASHNPNINRRLDFIRNTYEIKKTYADYFRKNISSSYFDTKMYEALLNEAFVSKDKKLSKALYFETKSKGLASFDIWKTYVLTVYNNNPLVLCYLLMRKMCK